MLTTARIKPGTRRSARTKETQQKAILYLCGSGLMHRRWLAELDNQPRQINGPAVKREAERRIALNSKPPDRNV